MQLKRIFSSINYLSVFVLMIPVGIVLQDNFPESPLIKGQAPFIVASWVIALVAGIIWLRQKTTKPHVTIGLYAIAAFAVAWTIITTLERVDGAGFNYNTYLVPILLIMVVIKPLDLKQVITAATILAASTLVLVSINEVVANLLERRDFGTSIGLRVIGIQGLTGGEVRWEGPFASPNYSGPVAAFLIVFSLSLAARWKWWLVVPSFILLLASGSRSAFLGLLIGLSCYFIFSKSQKFRLIKLWARLVIVGCSFIGFTAVAFYLDPTLNGRTPIWPLYIDFWQSSPVTGLGTEQIWGAIEAGEIEAWNVHAHNLMLDLMGRYGSFAAISVLAVFVLGVLLGIRAARRGNSVGLALIMTFFGIGITEVHSGWAYLNQPVAWLILGILLADSSMSSQNLSSQREKNPPQRSSLQSDF